MVRILGIDIPLGLEDLWAKIFQFDNNTTQEKLILKTSTPTRSSRSRLALQSLFVLWQDLYNGFTSSRRSSWDVYWGTLPFGSHGGANSYPGSGFSAFVYKNAPRYRAGLDLLLDPPQQFVVWCGAWTTHSFYNLGSLTYNQMFAMSFVPYSTYPISKVSVKAKKGGSPTDYLYLSIYSDDNGVPGNWMFDSETTFEGSSLSTTTETICDFLFQTHDSLISGTKYWFILKRSTSFNSSNYYTILVTTAYGGTNQRLMLWAIDSEWYLTGVYWQLYFQVYHST